MSTPLKLGVAGAEVSGGAKQVHAAEGVALEEPGSVSQSEQGEKRDSQMQSEVTNIFANTNAKHSRHVAHRYGKHSGAWIMRPGLGRWCDTQAECWSGE